MSVRVIIKDVKKRTKACDECKRRKGRCDGGMPCEWCSARNLECVFSAFSQKRGPKKKRKGNESDNEEDQDILTLDKREQGLSYDMELNNYLDLFMKYFDPLFTMFSQWEKGKVAQLTHPRSYSQFITKYAACAIAARASGQKERATQLITEARSFAGQCFDDMSVDGLTGFLLLSAYWLGIDSKVTKHYSNIALSIYSTIPPHMLPANIRYFMSMAAVVLNTAIADTDKVRVYLATANTIVPQNNSQLLMGSILRLCMKTFAHMKCYEATLLRSDISAVLLCQVIFSEKQRQGILGELRYCRTVAKLCAELSTEVSEIVNSFIVAMEVFVEWRSGHAERALPLAIDFANNCNPDATQVKYGNRFDVEHLLFMSIFLREQQHPALADKVRKTADSLHSVFYETLPELANSADHLTSYLRRKPIAQQDVLVVLAPPAPPSSYPHDPYSSIDDTVVPTMVNNVLSLVGQLLPSNNPKALLSAQGLHLFYNTLSSIIPPSPSPYDTLDEPPVEQSDAPGLWSAELQTPFTPPRTFSSPLTDSSSSSGGSSPPITPNDQHTSYPSFIDPTASPKQDGFMQFSVNDIAAINGTPTFDNFNFSGSNLAPGEVMFIKDTVQMPPHNPTLQPQQQHNANLQTQQHNASLQPQQQQQHTNLQQQHNANLQQQQAILSNNQPRQQQQPQPYNNLYDNNDNNNNLNNINNINNNNNINSINNNNNNNTNVNNTSTNLNNFSNTLPQQTFNSYPYRSTNPLSMPPSNINNNNTTNFTMPTNFPPTTNKTSAFSKINATYGIPVLSTTSSSPSSPYFLDNAGIMPGERNVINITAHQETAEWTWLEGEWNKVPGETN